jgi:hypothetical protein
MEAASFILAAGGPKKLAKGFFRAAAASAWGVHQAISEGNGSMNPSPANRPLFMIGTGAS